MEAKSVVKYIFFLMRNFKIDCVINRNHVLLRNCENMKIKMTRQKKTSLSKKHYNKVSQLTKISEQKSIKIKMIQKDCQSGQGTKRDFLKGVTL